MTLLENVNRIKNAVASIISSIRNKGATVPDNAHIEDLPAIIDGMSTGTDISDTTATAGDVLAGKSFYIANGTKTDGSIPSNTYGKTISLSSDDLGMNSNGFWMYFPYGNWTEYSNKKGSSWFYTNKDVFGDAAAGDVLSGKTFTSQNGVKVSGSIPSNGGGTGLVQDLYGSDGTNKRWCRIPYGYYPQAGSKSNASYLYLTDAQLKAWANACGLGYDAGVTAGRSPVITSLNVTVSGPNVSIPSGWYPAGFSKTVLASAFNFYTSGSVKASGGTTTITLSATYFQNTAPLVVYLLAANTSAITNGTPRTIAVYDSGAGAVTGATYSGSSWSGSTSYFGISRSGRNITVMFRSTANNTMYYRVFATYAY